MWAAVTGTSLQSCFEAHIPLDRLAAVLAALLFVALLLLSVLVRILAAVIRGPFHSALLLFVAPSLIVSALKLVCGLLLLCLKQMQ